MCLINEGIVSYPGAEVVREVLVDTDCSCISYDSFKESLKRFVKAIMDSYLDDIECYSNTCWCMISDIDLYTFGLYRHNIDSDIIEISNKVLERLYYNKNRMEFLNVLHELAHFEIYYDMINNKIDYSLINCIKEKLLGLCSMDSSLNNYFLSNSSIAAENYYQNNYDVYTEEIIANIRAVDNYIELCKIFNIECCKDEMVRLDGIMSENLGNLDIKDRDVSMIYFFNNDSVNLEDGFDFMIKYHPNWLEVPQLNIQYYLNGDGKVIKRTREELILLRDSCYDDDRINFINGLVDNEYDFLRKQLLK